MQCVILAAGKGTRLRPLTDEKPKPLVEINGTPIIEHIVARLPAEISELVLVVGYKEEMIREYCGEVFMGRRVQYCLQENPFAGTGDALFCAKQVLQGRFMFLYGDDIIGAGGLAELLQHEYAVSGYFMENLGRFGPVVLNSDGTMLEITLGVHNQPDASGLAYIGGVIVDTSIFETVTEQNRQSETLLVDMLNSFASKHSVHVVEQSVWVPIGFPEDVTKAEALLNE